MYEENISATPDPSQGINPDLQRTSEVAEKNLENLTQVADVQKAYGEAIQQNGRTIIPTAEVLAVAGFGSGFGRGTSQENGGSGGGLGGGGRSFSRPVAVIVAGPEGVEVKPVLDVSKIALTALTAFGFMIATIGRMQRGPRSEE
jgi:uncharacterized spore protein YtfJ